MYAWLTKRERESLEEIRRFEGGHGVYKGSLAVLTLCEH